MLTSTHHAQASPTALSTTEVSHKKVPLYGKMLSAVCHPFMWTLSGDIGRSPQHTHPWNHQPVPESEAGSMGFNQNEGVIVPEDTCIGDDNHGWNIRLPCFGGPRMFVVLTPYRRHYPWHVAWEGPHIDGLRVSKITLVGAVCMLVVNNYQTKFYGVHAETGYAISIRQIGDGIIGVDREFRHIPLL